MTQLSAQLSGDLNTLKDACWHILETIFKTLPTQTTNQYCRSYTHWDFQAFFPANQPLPCDRRTYVCGQNKFVSDNHRYAFSAHTMTAARFSELCSRTTNSNSTTGQSQRIITNDDTTKVTTKPRTYFKTTVLLSLCTTENRCPWPKDWLANPSTSHIDRDRIFSRKHRWPESERDTL